MMSAVTGVPIPYRVRRHAPLAWSHTCVGAVVVYIVVVTNAVRTAAGGSAGAAAALCSRPLDSSDAIARHKDMLPACHLHVCYYYELVVHTHQRDVCEA